MLRITLSEEEKKELELHRYQSSSKESEKALMILLSHEGHSITAISNILHRHYHTVRDWIHRYQEQGISGLKPKKSPGRPRSLRDAVKEKISSLIETSPTLHGYKVHNWTIGLLSSHYDKHLSIQVSDDTIGRALRDAGYTYKRPTKRTPINTLSKEEKMEKVSKMIEGIKEIIKTTNKNEYEVFSMDESHFSTEPYVVHGWQKKIS